MQLITVILPYAQIILSVILITAILLQQSGVGLGGAISGSESESFHHTRRGFEKFLFYLSIICGILFALSALLAIIINGRINPIDSTLTSPVNSQTETQTETQ